MDHKKYKLEIIRGRTDKGIRQIMTEVIKELMDEYDQLKQERRKIEELNESITEALYPAVDRLIKEYQTKESIQHLMDGEATCVDYEPLKKLTLEFGQRLALLLPMNQVIWFSETYEHTVSPMLDEYMAGATIMILKLKHWSSTATYEMWREIVPAYLKRDVETVREAIHDGFEYSSQSDDDDDD